MANGQCVCGAVRFEAEGPWAWFAHCHCSICRRHHGALFSTSVGAHVSRFRWVAGSEHVVAHRASTAFERPFCRRCGAKLPALSHQGDVMNVPAGTLDGDIGRPRTHIFVDSRSSCDVIDDDLRCYAEYPDGVGTSVRGIASAVPREGADVLGACACGTVAFAITGPLGRALHNHGLGARRSRGAAFATDAVVAASRLGWVRGSAAIAMLEIAAPTVPAREAPFATAFCSRCGALLPAVPQRKGRGQARIAIVPLGALDPIPDVRCSARVFADERSAWHFVDDGLTRLASLPAPEA